MAVLERAHEAIDACSKAVLVLSVYRAPLQLKAATVHARPRVVRRARDTEFHDSDGIHDLHIAPRSCSNHSGLNFAIKSSLDGQWL
jgi:hypothetical protein